MYKQDYDYEGEHSISFWKMSLNSSGKWIASSSGLTNSWDYFNLIPLNRPYIVLPTPNYSMVQIPGTNVRYDITEYIPGGKTYGNRSGSWSFAAPTTEDYKKWTERYEELKDYFNGSRFVVRLNDDPTTYYEGRVTVTNYEPGASYSTVTINYDLDPNTRNTLNS